MEIRTAHVLILHNVREPDLLRGRVETGGDAVAEGVLEVVGDRPVDGVADVLQVTGERER
jgi:hypothetical protein